MILLDNIIFSLQKSAGGIAKGWAKHLSLIQGLREDIRYFEVAVATENKFRREVSLPANSIYPERHTGILSRVWPRFPKADLVHSSYYRTGNRRQKSIITVHDFIHELHPSSRKDLIFSALKKRSIAKADAIITVSEHTRHDMCKLYPWAAEKEIIVIPNGVDDEFTGLDIVEPININGQLLTPNSFFLYVGSRGFCKNFKACKTFLDHEFTRDKNLKLVLVGGGQFNKEELEYFSENINLGQIVFVPFASSSLLNNLYNQAISLLFPSIYEGFGIPALEAARVGCVVLASHSSSIPEVVGRSPYMYDPLSKDEMEAALVQLDNADAVQKERERLIRHSHQFDWGRNTFDTSNLYDKLLGS